MSNCSFNLELKWKKNNKNAIIPSYQTEGSAGFDFHACIDFNHYAKIFSNLDAEIFCHNDSKGYFYILKAGCVAPIPTGLSVEIPKGYEIQIRPRSGLALKKQITIINSPGTIDEDFKGEIMVILKNSSHKDFMLRHGERVAQGILSRVYKASMIETDVLTETKRGSSGFGSTGI